MTDSDLHVAITLRDLAGNGAPGKVLMVVIPSALAGTLTIGGMTDATGARTPWVIPASSAGVLTTALHTGYPFDWAFSDPADRGKALLVYHP